MKRSQWLLLLIIIVFQNLFSADSTSASLQVGMDAPSFFLKDIENNDVFIRDFCGEALRQPWKNKIKHVVILSFFATWCVPCQKEVPVLEKLMSEYKDQPVKVFLIDVGEKAETVEAFIKEKGYKIPVLLDIYKMISTKKYDVTSLPRLFIIDKNGKIVLIKQGFENEVSFSQTVIPVLQAALNN